MFLRISFIFILIIFTSCSKDKPVYEAQKSINAFKVYKEGLEAFENNDFFSRAKSFQKLN